MLKKPEYFDRFIAISEQIGDLLCDDTLSNEAAERLEEARGLVMESAAESCKAEIVRNGDWEVVFYFSASPFWDHLTLTAKATGKHFEHICNQPIEIQFWPSGKILNVAWCNELPTDLVEIIRTYVPVKPESDSV